MAEQRPVPTIPVPRGAQRLVGRAAQRRRMKVYRARLLASPDWPTSANQPDVVVAATSREEAARAFTRVARTQITAAYLRAYGSITGNTAQVAAATSEPGTVFVNADRIGHTYVALRP